MAGPSPESASASDLSRPRSHRIVRAFTTQLFYRALGMVASVMTVGITTRHLGPGLYGQLTIAIVFIGMWTSFTELGIGAVIVRRVTARRGELERLVRINSGLSLVYCVPLTVVAIVSGMLLYSDTIVRQMIAIVAVSLLITTLTVRFEPVFLTRIQFTAVAVSDFVSRLASLVASFYLVQIDADVVWFAVVQLIPPTVMLLIQGFAASRVLSMRPIFGWAESLDLIRESLPQTGVLVIAVLYWRADGVILSLLSVSSEVGVYGLAYTLAFTTLVLSQFFLKSTLSTMTEEFNRAPEVFARLLRRGVEVMLFLGVPIGVIGAVLAGPIIELISSEEFVTRGEPTLALLMLAVAARFVGGTLGQALFAAHDQTYLFRLMIATLALNVGLNVALAGHFGAVGAAAALLATELIGCAFATRRLGRRCNYRTPWMFLVRLAVPLGLAVAVAVVLGGAHVVLAVLFAAAAYLGGNLLLGPMGIAAIKSIHGETNAVSPKDTTE